ncbi:hypothetical protein QAO71_10600 [Halopseudomonas sp. SMJS2]|uniref:hypothetical protein n=1 Tax=Halopseudomonas sp. SMJS2 TaxID=3041098 RepID=UPI002453019A|nr:hypothetical protein [Halopseudomonas sp. SMJS2]WGK60542.1 hypothetical protein QAO71_10600 [Halopseudomonas sp. SMJS2]
MACKLCNSGQIASLGMQTPHTYCRSCGGHEYEGQVINKAAWDLWINGKTPRPPRSETGEQHEH